MGLKDSMRDWAIRWFMGGIIRDIAEGKRGPKLKAAYWWATGKKTVTGFFLALLLTALYAYQPDVAAAWAPAMGTVAGALITLGVIDKQWRESTPPVWFPEALKTLVSLGPLASIIVAGLAKALPNHTAQIEAGAAAVGAATAWLAAHVSDPPEPTPEGK